jgi:hypothetical protein
MRVRKPLKALLGHRNGVIRALASTWARAAKGAEIRLYLEGFAHGISQVILAD